MAMREAIPSLRTTSAAIARCDWKKIVTADSAAVITKKGTVSSTAVRQLRPYRRAQISMTTGNGATAVLASNARVNINKEGRKSFSHRWGTDEHR
jgi:hypothetical protein